MKIKTIVLFLIMILIVGCTNNGGDTNIGRSKAFIGGSTGMLLDFLDGAPPNEVFDDASDFTISIKVENAGENDVIAANYENAPVLKITGIDPTDFGTTANLLTKTIAIDIEGSQLDSQGNVIKGTIETFDFPTDGNTLQYVGEIAGDVEFNLRASL